MAHLKYFLPHQRGTVSLMSPPEICKFFTFDSNNRYELKTQITFKQIFYLEKATIILYR